MTRPPDDPPSYNEVYIAHASGILEELIKIRDGSESVANQGQALDGYAQLANYNNLADDAKAFLEVMR